VATKTLINNRYELDELPLARGGMGEVWTGRDIKLEREVAVKFIRFPEEQEDQELVRRFVRESRITARLEHPGVPAVYDVGTHDGRPYLVMQRIRGISVADLNAEHAPLPVGWAAAIAAQTCSVLSVAHQASLVHRDLKPGNLMLDLDGGIKVLDFGLAVALDLADHSQITRTGQTLGTPAYMAPEQIMASMSGPRTDLYALGCTLFEMLCGQTPFTGSTAYAVMSRQVEERPRSLRSLRAEVPSGLERLVLALLEKRPDDRPESAEVVYERLLPFVDELGPLPGVLTTPSRPSATRMYAGVLSRVLAGSPARSVPEAPGPGVPAPRTATEDTPPPRFSRGELDRARAHATELTRQSRYSQAAEVLSAVIEPASLVLGSVDDDVLSLRREFASVLFEGGDYRRAAPQHRQLAEDLAARYGPDSERVLRHRLQEATCHALIGETSLALRQLNELLRDERRVFGEDDPRTLELRRQIGLLELGTGQRDRAAQTLTSLLADLTRLHGPDHVTVTGARDLLESIHPSAH
jgi:eukaryotic-like serine/threonine-protein kinase